MRFAGSRGHKTFDLDGGLPKGATTIITAAKDSVRVPEEPTIVNVVQRSLCRVELGEDCYIVKGMTGKQEIVPYGASLTQWEDACDRLLKLAMQAEVVK